MKIAIEPTEDLEVYLSYSRPTARYADFADIRSKLQSVAPTFDFDRTMTNPAAKIVTVRDAKAVCGMAVLVNNVMQLYYADDAASTRALMAQVEEMKNGQPAPNP